jgi:DNA-binding MarR family transcriptional regulator
MQISSPNAAYKVSSLIRKGYLRKVQSTQDRREYHLEVTEKYMDYYNISTSYLETVMSRITQQFSAEDCDKLEEMLTIISRDLMPEVRLPE